MVCTDIAFQRSVRNAKILISFFFFIFEILEWLLDDCVKQPFLRPPKRTIDRYTDRPFGKNSHRKLSHIILSEHTTVLRKNGTITNFASSEHITNGNADAL